MNKILDTTKYVVQNSKFVKINHKRLEKFADVFNQGDIKHWLSVAPFNFSNFSDSDKLHFLVVFDALSFSYWGEPKWTIDYKGKLYDGAWGMNCALGRAIEEGKNLLDFEYCSKISFEEFAYIMRGNIEMPLLEERWQILREIGLNMLAKFKGKASNMILKADGDSQKLLEIIIQNFPSFLDVSEYNNHPVYFYKRAQLLIADIFIIFHGDNFGKLKNIDQLTACADYKLPQILRKLGIFEYDKEMAEKIDNKIEIQHNCQEEVEIRANTIWAVELIKQRILRFNPKILSIEVNDYLWLATQEKFDGDKPYHRTRTTAY